MQLEYFSYLVVVMWLAWRDLNGGADIPVYSFLVGPDVMDATYISSVVWHSPLSTMYNHVHVHSTGIVTKESVNRGNLLRRKAVISIAKPNALREGGMYCRMMRCREIRNFRKGPMFEGRASPGRLTATRFTITMHEKICCRNSQQMIRGKSLIQNVYATL